MLERNVASAHALGAMPMQWDGDGDEGGDGDGAAANSAALFLLDLFLLTLIGH